MECRRFQGDDGYPMVDLDSDQDEVTSSEDEIDVILRGTPEQKRHLRRRSLGLASSSSEDDFEKAMNKELDQTMKEMHQNLGTGISACKSADAEDKHHLGQKVQKLNDDGYFDCDSDEEPSSTKERSRKSEVLSNDDLLYDPDMDDDDQQWVDRQRRKYQPAADREGGRPSKILKKDTGKGSPASSACRPQRCVQPLPHSDAVLNCPACMTQLCLDCQRHVKYRHQYRAMFVMNCSVDKTESLRFPEKMDKKTKKQQRKQKWKEAVNSQTQDPEIGTSVVSTGETPLVSQPVVIDNEQVGSQNRADPCGRSEPKMDTDSFNTQTPPDTYHPVRCQICSTEVGVFDKDEVYHFFNVLSSHS